ncbi:MAG: hypothetical protein STSR0004_08270 [Peptococcaceae bacterium]
MQSPIYQDWVKKEQAEAEAKGKIEGKIEAICKFMVRRFNAGAGEIRAKVYQVPNSGNPGRHHGRSVCRSMVNLSPSSKLIVDLKLINSLAKQISAT